MAHGLACQLGGTLTIASRLGEGTEVAMWVPRSDEAPRAIDAGPRASARRSRGEVVLLVDDEDAIRASTADMLLELGFTVHAAASAEAALRALEAGVAPDILVTDHLMPGMTGVALAHEMRARRPEVRVLVVSGFAEVDGIDPSLPRLTKPFVQADLARCLLGGGESLLG
jgi:CheY-like chemotaxis protein